MSQVVTPILGGVGNTFKIDLTGGAKIVDGAGRTSNIYGYRHRSK
jgi:hypothetical protein